MMILILITFLTACVQDALCNEAYRSWRSHCGRSRPTCPVHTFPTDNGVNITVKSILKLASHGICHSTIASRNVNGRKIYICQMPDCLPLPCQHGGKCKETLTGFECHCPSAFTGETCETDVDECSRTGALYPCDAAHGECTNIIGSYVCSCTAGYKLEGTGVLCIVDEECFTGNGQDYGGFVNTTQKGVICQKWTATSPHSELLYTPITTPNAGLGDHNYCRNPDADIGVWCYTTDPERRWDYCNIGQAQPVCARPV